MKLTAEKALGVTRSHVLTVGIKATTFKPEVGGGVGKQIAQLDWPSEKHQLPPMLIRITMY